MLRLIILSIISFKLVADDSISLSFATLSGTSSYSVWQGSSALKSKLLFPINSTLLDLRYDKMISDNLTLSFDYSTNISKHDTKGEDYDWQYDKLSVYSYSKNILENYQSFLLFTSYTGDLLTYLFSLSYRYTSNSWSDTNQIDYIKDEKSFLDEESVTYKQNSLYIGFSPKYSFNSKKIIFSLMPSICYGVNFTKDNHINREFNAKATYKGFAYATDIKVGYKILKNTTIKLFYKTFYFKDDNSDLEYKSDEGFKFRTLPSSFSSDEQIVGLELEYFL